MNNPFTTPYCSMTFLDSSVVFLSLTALFILSVFVAAVYDVYFKK